MRATIGKKVWAVPEGYIPAWSYGKQPELESHETLCILNANNEPADVKITVFYEDRPPSGPYQLRVPPQRTKHLRFNELEEPEPISKGRDFASVIESSAPIVVQHTRLDSRQNENALMTTIAFAG